MHVIFSGYEKFKREKRLNTDEINVHVNGTQGKWSKSKEKAGKKFKIDTNRLDYIF